MALLRYKAAEKMDGWIIKENVQKISATKPFSNTGFLSDWSTANMRRGLMITEMGEEKRRGEGEGEECT